MSESKRTVKLFCPSLSKAVQLVADENQRLDLGSIARSFGLEPATLKLNGHFISRGVDLIASSVTWKSLISFFSSRGLSTGTSGSGALVIDGKLSKSGSKRTHDSVDGTPSMSDRGYDNINRRPPLEDSNSIKKTKFKDPDVDNGSRKHFITNALKRKQEDASSSLKRFTIHLLRNPFQNTTSVQFSEHKYEADERGRNGSPGFLQENQIISRHQL
ncbi:hypothetical protein Ccrd_017892 [Cynara cardunculus var. scolymus]|uniref:Uncharacterized protein n=1 Tax=Cynara cardunculus var. scolymus TaxID=59895 RepID=A0A103Y789_CYNCS|nr:hypothetical protein Ccrd_017892 [Cynara cardunculus var. scolymus]